MPTLPRPWVPEGHPPTRTTVLVRSVTCRMHHDVVDQGTDRQSGAGTHVRSAPGHVAHLERSVGSRAGAAADSFDGEEIVAHHDLDVGAHILLVLDGVGPMIVRVQWVRAVVRVRDYIGSAERVVLRAGCRVPGDVDDAARALEHAGGAGLLVRVLLRAALDQIAARVAVVVTLKDEVYAELRERRREVHTPLLVVGVVRVNRR